MISRGLDGQPGNDDSNRPVISANGRFVAFYSRASNLMADDTNNRSDVFVYDRPTGSLERVSVSSEGQQSNDNSTIPAISADGRFIIFSSVASNLVIGDTNNTTDVFRHDRWTGITERLSLTWQAQEPLGTSAEPAVSPDGRFVAFTSNSDNLVPNDTNENYDVFVRDQPYAVLDANHSGGGPGSYFSLTAAHFPPTTTATITVNGLSLGTVETDGSGQAAFRLDTTSAGPGYYQVRLTVAPYWAAAEFILYVGGQLHPLEGSGPIFIVPADIANRPVFLPFLP
jgi:tricorn protease-like protein